MGQNIIPKEKHARTHKTVRTSSDRLRMHASSPGSGGVESTKMFADVDVVHSLAKLQAVTTTL